MALHPFIVAGTMRICTWNINSVRLRSALLKKLAKACAPDIICLQETKTPDEFFPLAAVEALGYVHTHVHGMKAYNGVAVLSKVPFTTTEIHHRVGREDRRHISVHVASKKFKKPVEIHCLYIPAGGDMCPIRRSTTSSRTSWLFVDEMAAWFAVKITKGDAPLVVLGDLNIAPLEHDVWSHKQLLQGRVTHTEIEVEKFARLQASLGWHDAVRHFVSEDEKCYTWWSYRNRDWRKSNRGRRLDHIWIMPPLVTACCGGHRILVRSARLAAAVGPCAGDDRP